MTAAEIASRTGSRLATLAGRAAPHVGEFCRRACLAFLRWLWAWIVWVAVASWRFTLANLQRRRRRALRRIAYSALSRYWAHDGDPMAGYIAYSVFLSLFPFSIFVVSVSSAFIVPQDQQEAVEALFQLAPPHIAETLRPVVVDVATPRGSAFITTFSIIALYVASNAVEAIRMAFERAYQVQRPVHWIVSRLRAVAFVLLSTVTFIVLGVLIIGVPLGLQIAENAVGFRTPYGVTFLRYAVALTLFPLFLYQLHTLLPSQRPPAHRLRPGIVTTMVLWVLAATAFSVYLLWTPYYASTYGALSGVIVTLFFFYLSAAIVLYGAEVNAVLMKFRPPKPRRRAWAAARRGGGHGLDA